MYIGDWEKREWKVFSDGSYILETTFSQVNDKHRVTSSFNKYKFLLLKQLLKLDWDKHVRDSDGDDGEVWKMQMLNKAGEIIKKSGRSKYPWYNPIFNVIVNLFLILTVPIDKRGERVEVSFEKSKDDNNDFYIWLSNRNNSNETDFKQ